MDFSIPYYLPMKINLSILIAFKISLFIINSCTSSEETQLKKQEIRADTVYVFDEIPPEDIFEFESPVLQWKKELLYYPLIRYFYN